MLSWNRPNSWFANVCHDIADEMYVQIAAAFFAGMIAVAPAAFAADLENGAQVFAGNCAACHAGGNNVIQNEKVSSTLSSLIMTAYTLLRHGISDTPTSYTPYRISEKYEE